MQENNRPAFLQIPTNLMEYRSLIFVLCRYYSRSGMQILWSSHAAAGKSLTKWSMRSIIDNKRCIISQLICIPRFALLIGSFRAGKSLSDPQEPQWQGVSVPANWAISYSDLAFLVLTFIFYNRKCYVYRSGLYLYTETVFVNSDACKTDCGEEVKPGKHSPTGHKRRQVITRW